LLSDVHEQKSGLTRGGAEYPRDNRSSDNAEPHRIVLLEHTENARRHRKDDAQQ
jgi:hypothetical protein